ncbi:zinc-ribbon domain-containing protein [Priestia megaterium]|uniref:zinc-ribbon domain-containing protein n=1 Tax=Priestia megaterium TaxID=1404 RepID=UPI001EEAD9A5|nr:zinc-ribbon domain-containing protein [Priestia megaterium]
MKKALKKSLYDAHYKLSLEWHDTKNGDLRPNDVAPSSNRRVWWKCEKGHEWETSICNRIRIKGGNCPYCTNKRVCGDNCLATLRPEIAKEWHPTKNGLLTPYDVVMGSSKKVWWKCEKGHEWETKVCNRTRKKGAGCHYCCGQKVLFENSIVITHPELLRDWHALKNANIKPSNISYGSDKKVWWKCEKGHEWEARVSGRTMKNSGCPYCSGRNATGENCLAAVYPEIAKEWHPTKNKLLTPYDVTPKSGSKVWWRCEEGHEWRATIHQRGEGTNCPRCKVRTSFPEQAIFHFIQKRLNNTISQHVTDEGVEFDIFNSELSFAVEYDGYHWHKPRYKQDIEKSDYARKKGIFLVRVREKGLKEVSPNFTMNIFTEVFVQNDSGFSELNRVISQILKVISEKNNLSPKKMSIDTERQKYKIIEGSKKIKLVNSIAFQYPHLAKEWHPTKNKKSKPEHFQKGAHVKVWWQCHKGHEWESFIYSRTVGVGCPYCANRRVCIDNCLATLRPEIAKEWHPTKNGSLTPYDVVIGTYKEVWWRCEKGHEWETKVCNRTSKTGTGCPCCYRRNRLVKVKKINK